MADENASGDAAAAATSRGTKKAGARKAAATKKTGAPRARAPKKVAATKKAIAAKTATAKKAGTARKAPVKSGAPAKRARPTKRARPAKQAAPVVVADEPTEQRHRDDEDRAIGLEAEFALVQDARDAEPEPEASDEAMAPAWPRPAPTEPEPTSAEPPSAEPPSLPPPGFGAPAEPKRPRRRRRKIVVVSVVVILLAALLAGGVYYLVAANDDNGVGYTSLKPGDCFNNPPENFKKVVTVACSRPHDLEVVAVVTDPSPKKAPYPGTAALVQVASERCAADFAAYVGVAVDQSQLRQVEIVPQKSSWDDGSRKLVCTVRSGDGAPTAGSARGSRR